MNEPPPIVNEEDQKTVFSLIQRLDERITTFERLAKPAKSELAKIQKAEQKLTARSSIDAQIQASMPHVFGLRDTLDGINEIHSSMRRLVHNKLLPNELAQELKRVTNREEKIFRRFGPVLDAWENFMGPPAPENFLNVQPQTRRTSAVRAPRQSGPLRPISHLPGRHTHRRTKQGSKHLSR
jgi:hypothetical protein